MNKKKMYIILGVLLATLCVAGWLFTAVISITERGLFLKRTVYSKAEVCRLYDKNSVKFQDMSEWLLTMEFSEIEPQTLSSYEGETRKKLEDFFAEEHLSHIYRYSYDEVHVIQFVMDKEAFRFWNGIFYVETPSLEETTKNALENVGVVFTYTKKLEDHFYYFEE